jgi:starch phosphorylase
MSEPAQTHNSKKQFFSRDVEGFDSLSELALDMRSAWNHAADLVWQQLDPELWDMTRNPPARHGRPRFPQNC